MENEKANRKFLSVLLVMLTVVAIIYLFKSGISFGQWLHQLAEK